MARTLRTSAGCTSSPESCICTRLAPPRCPQPCLEVCAPITQRDRQLTGDFRTSGRTNCSPVHGCLPLPLQGRASAGPGRGHGPPQHTILRLEPASATRVRASSKALTMGKGDAQTRQAQSPSATDKRVAGRTGDDLRPPAPRHGKGELRRVQWLAALRASAKCLRYT